MTKLAPSQPDEPRARANNPFYMAIDGLQKLFSKAPQIAFTMAILSGLFLLLNDRTRIDVPDSAVESNQAAEAFINDKTTQFVDKIQAIEAHDWIIIGSIAALFLIGALVAFVLINGVNSYTAARLARDKTATLSEALDAVFDRFFTYVGLQLLIIVKVLLWSLLFIIPGVIMAIRYSLANVAFFDKNLSARDSIQRSLALTKRAWVTTYAAQALFNLITFGLIRLLVQPAVSSTLYHHLASFEDSGKPKPKPHVLSWAVLLLPTLGFVSVLLLGLLVAAA